MSEDYSWCTCTDARGPCFCRKPTLTERLAQAERKAEQQMALANKLERELEQAERERDAWQSKAQHWETVAGGISREAKRTVADRDEWKMRCEVGADQMRVERDAALARYEQAQQDANRALAKAEAAEKAFDAAMQRETDTEGLIHDLRARIEALADKYERRWGDEAGILVSNDLRALLTPPKAETALDVVAAMDERFSSDEVVTPYLAKLRKLLEEGK